MKHKITVKTKSGESFEIPVLTDEKKLKMTKEEATQEMDSMVQNALSREFGCVSLMGLDGKFYYFTIANISYIVVEDM